MRILGIRPSREIGVILERLLERVLDDPSLNDAREAGGDAARAARSGEVTGRRTSEQLSRFATSPGRKHPRIQVAAAPRRATSAESSWVRARRRGGVLLDPQRTARAPPSDARHPGGWRRRRRRRVGDRVGAPGRALPPREVRPRAARVDARGRPEMLAEVEQHVDHAGPHLARRGQRPRVIAVADDLPLAPEGAVDRQRQPDCQAVHAPAGSPGLVPLDDEVAVVLLDREVDHPEPVDRRPRDGAPERPEHRGERSDGSPGVARMVTCTGYRGSTFGRVSWGIEGRPRGFRPAPLRAPPHVRGAPRGKLS